MQPHIPLPPMAPYPQSADANLLQWMNPMMAPETFVESPEVSIYLCVITSVTLLSLILNS